MSEMLGNQYFIARNYAAAQIELEKSFVDQPESKPLRRKLIVCYSQTGKIYKSLDIFISLIQEDIDFIIDADVIHDDCPCPELIENFEENDFYKSHEFEHDIMMGILWLYCDVDKSLKSFMNAGAHKSDDEQIKLCLASIQNYLKNQNSKVKISL